MKGHKHEMKEHCYKGNKIVEYEKELVMAYYIPDPTDPLNIESKSFSSLKDAERWLDDNGYSIE